MFDFKQIKNKGQRRAIRKIIERERPRPSVDSALHHRRQYNGGVL
jgi:hypothetical protein